MKDANVKKKKKEKKANSADYNSLTMNSMIKLVILGAIAVIVLYVMTFLELKHIRVINLAKDARITVNDEKEEKGSVTDILSNKEIKEKDRVTIKMKIPDKLDMVNPVLAAYTCNSTMHIYLDDKQVYAIGEDFKYGDLIGTELFKVDLGNDCDNKEIKIVIDTLDPSTFNRMYKIYLANSNDIDVFFARKQLVNIYISNFLFIFGIICIFYNWGGFRKHSHAKRELLIAFTAITGGIWIISCESIATYYGIDAKNKYYLEYESLYTMIFFGLKMFYTRMNDVKQRKFLKAMEYTIFIYIIIANFLRVMKIGYFQEILSGFHMILVLSTIIYFIVSIINIKKYMDVFLIFSALFLGIGAYITVYTFKINFMFEDTDFAALSVLLLGIYMFISLFNEIRVSYMNKIERQLLMNKVYFDKLTNINNRRSCEQYMKLIDKDKEKCVKIYSFDINGLKIVNDKYGHKKGDELIKEFANVLKEVFKDKKNDFIGRMGGDEFIVITNYKNDDMYENVSSKITQLNTKIKNINNSNKYDFEISYAYGMSICNRKKDDKVWEIYNFADKQMYDNKRRMKENISILREKKI